MAGGLDHLVVVARDLDALAAFYARVGFKVGARNRHDWGTLNHIVQFDGCFLELLTTEAGFVRPPAEAPVAAFAGPIDDYLAAREGLAMMVIEGFDAGADHAAFQAAGIGVPAPFSFRRQGKRPDGSTVEVAFSLAFARTPEIADAGFFVYQQHAPELFWNPAFQEHANSVTGVRRVAFAASEPARHKRFFESYTGVLGEPAGDGGIAFPLARGRLEVLTPDALEALFGAERLPALDTPRFAAVEFSAADRARARDVLAAGGVAVAETGGRLVVSASEAFGLTLAFS